MSYGPIKILYEAHIFVLNVIVIVERVRVNRAPFYRPALPGEESAGVHPGILTLMKQCWAEEPSYRPSFDEITRTLKSINKGKSALLIMAQATFLRIIVWNDLSFGMKYSIIVCLMALNNTVKPPPQGGFTQGRSPSICLSVRPFVHLFVCRLCRVSHVFPLTFSLWLRRELTHGVHRHATLVRSALSYTFHSVAAICGISVLNYEPTLIKHYIRLRLVSDID